MSTRSATRQPVARGPHRRVQGRRGHRPYLRVGLSQPRRVPSPTPAFPRWCAVWGIRSGRTTGKTRSRQERRIGSQQDVPLSDSFPHAPPGDNRDDGTKRVFLQPREIFFETVRDNNLKICEVPAPSLATSWQGFRLSGAEDDMPDSRLSSQPVLLICSFPSSHTVRGSCCRGESPYAKRAEIALGATL